MLFPYRDEDLIDEISFRQMCKKKGYSLLKRDLEYYSSKGIIERIYKKDHFIYYSKYQFYILKYIRDNRYGTNGLIRTYHNFDGASSEKVFQFFDDSVKEFDIKFKRDYVYRFNSFFELYYKIEQYCIDAGDYIYNRVSKLPKDNSEERTIISQKTAINNFQKEYWEKTPLLLSTNEITNIRWFSNIFINNNSEYVHLFLTTSNAKQKFKGLAQFEIVQDLIEIINVIEIYENISGEKLKDIRLNRLSEAGSMTRCKMCGDVFLKKRRDQICCSPACGKKYNNEYRKKMRENDSDYGK